jgi:hypothetical protein
VNQIQDAIARVTGISEVVSSRDEMIAELVTHVEAIASDNTLLQRQLEDIDYLNLFENSNLIEVLPIADRKKVLARLRLLRHDNPLAKQGVKLIVRFTLGKGVQWILADPAPTGSDLVDAAKGELPDPPESGSSPTPPTTTKPVPTGTKIVQIPRAARANEADLTSIDDQSDVDVEEIRDIWTAFWQDSDNQLAFTKHNSMKVFLDDTVTDGEKFHAAFTSAVAPYIKVSEIPLEEIVNIISHPDNRLKPVFYQRQYQPQIYDGQSETYKPDGKPRTEYYYDYRILEEEKGDIAKKIKLPKGKINQEATIVHSMINEVSTKRGKRGVSELYASREWFRVFREFMEGRASINAAANAISYIRKIKGGPTAVAQFGGKFGGLNVGDSPGNGTDEARRLTRPVAGSIYDSNPAMDLEWMTADTGAQNAKEDARLLLMSAGAGMSTNIHYFGEGGDANLATAQAMELPMVKSYEDWQQYMEDFFRTWFQYVVTTAKDKETADKAMQRLGFTFPPIISQDIVKYTTSWSQIIRDIAPNNMAARRQAIRACMAIMGVPNIDGLMPEIEAEMAKAEAQRQVQQQQMMELAAQNPAPAFGGPKPPGTPPSAMDPNTQHLIKGKGEKAANGPKSA